MKLLAISATALLATAAGWAFSVPATMNPANGWLIAMFAALGMTLKALHTVGSQS